MSMPGYSPRPPRGPGVHANAFSVSGIATMVVAGVFLLIIIVSLFGSADDGEPKQVLRIEAAPHGTGGALSGAAPATTGELLVGADGIVISDPTLLEAVAEGHLPRVADDGRKPSQVYARSFDASDPRPKIAIILGGLGLGEAVTQAAIDRLPAGVTLAFTPYGSSLQSVVAAARAKGHEVLLEVPMEPHDYPDNDPGQNTLLTGVAAAENPARLRWIMARVAGYAGLINSQGAKFLSSQDDVRFVVGEANRRGLYLVDSGDSEQSIAREVAQGAGAPFARADQQIDRDPRREAIERVFASLETLAKQRGVAIGIATAIPVTVDRVSAWALELEQKGIALAPVSAMTKIAPATRAPSPPTSAAPKPAPRRAARAPARQRLPTTVEPAFDNLPAGGAEAAPHP